MSSPIYDPGAFTIVATIDTPEGASAAFPLADGSYEYKVYGRNGLKSATSLVVSDNGATYTVGTTTTTAYSLADFKSMVKKQIEADNSVTISSPEVPHPAVGEKSSTPWLLYAAGAAVLFFLWKKRK